MIFLKTLTVTGILLIYSCQAMSKEKIAIIGAGAAGIATTIFLSELDNKIVIFEKNNEIGGNAREIEINNEYGKKIKIDLGPQYFSKKGWGNYVGFLKYHNQFNKKDYYSFKPSIVVYNSQVEAAPPLFVSPKVDRYSIKWSTKTKDSTARGLEMFKFLSKSYKFNKNSKKYPSNLTFQSFLDSNNFDSKYLEEFINPIAAAVTNFEIKDVPNSHMESISDYISPSHPLSNSKYYVAKNGIATALKNIFRNYRYRFPNLLLKKNSEVVDIKTKENGRFEITYNQLNNHFVESFDRIIFAIPPYAIKKIINNDSRLRNLKRYLEVMPYKQAKVIIHNEHEHFISREYKRFLNIGVDGSGDYFISMQLNRINKDFTNYIKSWDLSEYEYSILKSSGKIKHESTFWHPLISKEFRANVHYLKRHGQSLGKIHFAGGWTQRSETQETAILSGFHVLTNIDNKHSNIWKKRIPSLSKVNIEL
ncbi:MAG: NAD(P)-binding protein [Bacteriovoracaceae bacterium]|nr:NAD(P)-binding protein [Bacteriovoracaceae bacterium]